MGFKGKYDNKIIFKMKVYVIFAVVLTSVLLVRGDDETPSSDSKNASPEVKEEDKSASTAVEPEAKNADSDKEESKSDSQNTSKVRRSPEESEEKKAPEEKSAEQEKSLTEKSAEDEKSAEPEADEKSASDESKNEKSGSKEAESKSAESEDKSGDSEDKSAVAEKTVSVFSDDDGLLDILGRSADADPAQSSRSGFGFPIHDYGSRNRLFDIIPPVPSLLPPPVPSALPPLPVMTPLPSFLPPSYVPPPPSYNTPAPPLFLPQAPLFRQHQVPQSFFPPIQEPKFNAPVNRIAVGRYKPETKDIDVYSAAEKTSNAYPFRGEDNHNHNSPSYEVLSKIRYANPGNVYKSFENNFSSNFNPYEVRRGRRTPSPYNAPPYGVYQPYPYYKMR